jgi:hypothetical protein
MAGAETDPAPPLDSRTANYEVVDRIRDLVKWLVLVLGAIGGVLLTGIQVSDLGKVHGDDRLHAVLAIGAGAAGTAAALYFAIKVLLPIRLIAAELMGDRDITWMVSQERGLLAGHGSVAALVEARQAAIDGEHTAWEAHRAAPDDPAKEADYTKARALAERPNDAVQKLLAFLLANRVREKMKAAMWAAFGGGAVVVGAIIWFSILTSRSDGNSIGEAVPERLGAVVVRLTAAGREELAQSLGNHCGAGRLRAIALGGPPDAIEMTTVPRFGCRPVRFTLSPGTGSVVNGERPQALRACALPHPSMPCVVYPNSATLIVGER